MKKLIALLFLTAPLQATVLVDTQTASGVQTGAGLNTWSMTIGSGINRAVVVGCEANAVAPVNNISSVTVGGVLAVLVRAEEAGNNRAELWIATGVPSGSQVINVHLDPGYQGLVMPCGAISFENVNQSSPIDTSTGTTIGGSVSSVTWTTTVSSTMLVDVQGQGTTSDIPVVGNGQTLQWSVQNLSRFTSQVGSTKLAPIAGVQTMYWTLNVGQIGMVATAIKSAVGAPDINSISPQTKGMGEPGFTLTVNGVGFVSGATVTWNGANRATTFVNSTQLTAVILSTDIASIAVVSVRVVNPDTARTGISEFDVTGDITLVWATDGGYKPTQEDLYGTDHSSITTATRIWDGTTITPFQAKNEINGFALVLENNTIINTSTVSVIYPVLTGPNGYVISSTPATVSTMFDWRNRPIQLYKVNYLPINGISRLSWENYDETHYPERWRATHTVNGNGQGIISGGWTSRPDYDKSLPDILIPIEAFASSTFTVKASSSQAIWVDIYVPKDAPAGEYTGTIAIYEGVGLSLTVPIRLMVYPFTMPDAAPSKVLGFVGGVDITARHQPGQLGFDAYDTSTGPITQTRIRYWQELYRHGITPVGDSNDGGCGTLVRQAPCPEYQMMLSGSLFSPTSGYANAPGVLTPAPLYAMFPYASWPSTDWTDTQDSTCENASTWVNWFLANAPKAEYFWYMVDEPSDFTNTNRWSGWISTCPAPGNQLPTFVTARASDILESAPNVTNVATVQSLGIAADAEIELKTFLTDPVKRIYYYNGNGPWNGSLTTDDDGIAPRVMQWMQYKKKYDSYFIWQTTYWNDSNNGMGQTDLFHKARTFGLFSSTSATFGYTGYNYQNGDGVLMYPGDDGIYTADSYGIDGPIPSWRLKMWRRGINDFTYLKMAAQYEPKTVAAIVQRIIPQVLWEYGVFDSGDPTYQYGPHSWSSDPDVWERAREELADIISRHH